MRQPTTQPATNANASTQPAPRDGTITAADLLTDDGTVDVSLVKHRQSCRISARECGEIRRRLHNNPVGVRDIAPEYEITHNTLRHHATGSCRCLTDVPAVRPTPGGGRYTHVTHCGASIRRNGTRDGCHNRTGDRDADELCHLHASDDDAADTESRE